MKRITLSLVSMIALSSISFAGGDITPDPVPVVLEETAASYYVGIALADTSTRGSEVDLNFFDKNSGQDNLINITFNAGYEFNQYIAIEGRYTTDVSQQDSADNMSGWSLFAKPQYPVSQDFTVYALLGFGGVTVEGGMFDENHNYYPVDVDDIGFQWGLGVSYSLQSYTGYGVSIFADYTSLANDMDGVYGYFGLETDVDVLTVGVSYQF